MIKKGALYKLIKSLTKSEKRYFKIAINSESKNYLRLFSFLDKQTRYDEKELKKHFQNQAFAKQLHVTKSYLSNLILRSLVNFHQKSSKDLTIKANLESIPLLFQKELFNQCEVTIEKTIKLAEKYEQYASLLECYDWKRQLLILKHGATGAKKEIIEINEKQNEILKIIFNINEYYELSANFFDYFQTSTQISQQVYTSLSKNPLITSADNALSTRAKILYYNLLFAYHIYKDKNYHSALQSLDLLVKMLERTPHLIKESPSDYIEAINNQISILLHTKNYDAIPQLLRQIRNAPKKFGFKQNSPTNFKNILQTFILELELYRDTGNFKKGLTLINPVTALLKESKSKIIRDFDLTFYYHFAYLNFCNQEFIQSQFWLDKIINAKTRESQQDAQTLASFLNALNQVEQNKHEHLPRLTDDIKNKIRQFRRTQLYEREILDFLKRYGKRPKKELVLDIENKLNLLIDDQNFSTFNHKLNIVDWLSKQH